MSVKEKMVELLRELYAKKMVVSFDEIADHFIANGVTAQEWISVEERLPEKSDDYIVAIHYPGGVFISAKRSYSKMRGWYGVSSGHYYAETAVTHWMPLPKHPYIDDKSNID